MNSKQKKNLIRILVASVLLVALHFVPVTGGMRFFCYLIPYLTVGYDILRKAAQGIMNRQPFDENLLMAIATIGAIVLAFYTKSHDFTEAVAVMLFYQIGEWFQSYAVGKSRRNITALMDIRPDHAHIEDENGVLKTVDPDDVEIGTTIVVQPGEKIPIDGVVLEGNSALNTAALTGESLPRDVSIGDEVLSGCINLHAVLRVQTTKEFDESTASKILELLEDASSQKARSEEFISRFARVYTPIVVYAALALALLPPVIRLFLGSAPDWGNWIYRALTFLVISCPCALVISIPLSFFAGIGGASRVGILVKGSGYLEALSKVRTIVFDKTGTLTEGSFVVTAVRPVGLEERQLLHLAAHAEHYSTHPIASALRDAYSEEHDDCVIGDTKEIAGRGVCATVDGQEVRVGNQKMMEEASVTWQPCEDAGTVIHVAVDGAYAGYIVIADRIKSNATQAIRSLRQNGHRKLVMLTGDEEKVASDVASVLGIDAYYAGLLPAEKVARVEELLKKERSGQTLAFVGDGINDAPVLARSDIGIAMGAMGSDAAIEAADIVLMDDDPRKILTAIQISEKCLRIVRENNWFAIGIKTLCLILGALGIANMWAAIFADVGVMVIAVLNAMRSLTADLYQISSFL